MFLKSNAGPGVMNSSPRIDLTPQEKKRLLAIARESIETGLASSSAPSPAAIESEGRLGEPLASFVTLKKGDALRGCVGSLEADLPLAQSVAMAAYSAAFRDTRFPPLSSDELEEVWIEISVLSRLEPVEFVNESELMSTLVPFVDGVVLKDGGRTATFLPKVWENRPDPAEFLAALKLKAGLPVDYWHDKLSFDRYTTVSFAESAEHRAES